MTPSDLTRLQGWFIDFCASYTRDADDEARRNFRLKETHTLQVRAAAKAIAAELEWPETDLHLAEAVGLLHDVGRFPQYRAYRTFKDADSVNHAAESVRIIARERLLNDLPEEERRLIIRSVALHNVYRLPDGLSERESQFLRLIRDADKLDIWRVFLEYYSLPEEERASAVGLGFPDLPGCSPEALTALREERMINLATVNSLNDFKLLQLSWIFDLNFRPTRRMFRERGYLRQFSDALPADDGIRHALSRLASYLEHTMPDGRDAAHGGASWTR